MKGPLREIRPDEAFWRFGERIHFVGIAQSWDDRVWIFWGWDDRENCRYYLAFPQWEMEQVWKQLSKSKKDSE